MTTLSASLRTVVLCFSLLLTLKFFSLAPDKNNVGGCDDGFLPVAS